MGTALTTEALDTLFLAARTFGAWQDKPVSDELLQRVWDLARMGPTSSNSMPVRVVFVKSAAAKEKLKPALSGGNVEKTMAAPVTAIVAHDMRFHEFMGKLRPGSDKFVGLFTAAGAEERLNTHVFRNGSLGGAYLMLAARAVGLDCGPMSGFGNGKVDAAFFGDGRWKSNFLCNLGYGDASKLHPRGARLDFAEACRIE